MDAKRPPTLIVAGGGTGGHVLAGIAVADAWRSRFGATLSAPVLFVGARGGIEEMLVPRAGYPLELLQLGSLNGVSLKRKLKTLLQLPLALSRSAAILLRHRPDAVIGVGGYASGPLILVARILSILRVLRCRCAILEQNSVPGFTNRILGTVVEMVFCAFPGTEGRFRTRAILTGNPIRSSMRLLPSANREPFTIFVFGGSQGALGINSLVLDALPLLEDMKEKLRIIHQTGERDYERVVKGYQDARFEARIEKFIHEMPAVYESASLLICRAGSSTLAEIAAVGRAAVLVPFPFASDDHQQKNAEVFANAGAARLMRQIEPNRGTGRELASVIRHLIAHPVEISDMEKAATLFCRPNAAADIVKNLAEHHAQ
ncbi:MAG TPA: undecaprenyldiphospho-muramoylpentapeptide beta-N-acetylglucosaminyltransferase [Bdellovibrionota bacterium]|nr:undecaprenyldiphospho-muramoylpentapeptide beta-N-acetylglucosaminyltransferase [Bdellovibrionota bacterium]